MCGHGQAVAALKQYMVVIEGESDYWFEAKSDEDARRGILVDLTCMYPNGVPKYTVYRLEEV